MSPARVVLVPRRPVALAALAAGVALFAVTGGAAGPTPSAVGAERAVAASVSGPVHVPVDVAFDLDVVPLSVTPEHAAVRATGGLGAATPTRTEGSVREVATATLAELPASAGITLLLHHPDLGGHLGGVFLGSPGYLLLNASRLAGDADRTRDVVRHEIAHVYQARLAATRGLAAVESRLTGVFGPGGLERSADCVALAFGATWTHYTSDCAGPERQAAVAALIGGRMP